VWRPNPKILNWDSFREKEDRIMRKKLKELKPVPDGVERLECWSNIKTVMLNR
jgi:hypothetical protein